MQILSLREDTPFVMLLTVVKKETKNEFTGSVFVCRLPRGCVEVISDCMVNLTGDDWVVDGLFVSL